MYKQQKNLIFKQYNKNILFKIPAQRPITHCLSVNSGDFSYFWFSTDFLAPIYLNMAPQVCRVKVPIYNLLNNTKFEYTLDYQAICTIKIKTWYTYPQQKDFLYIVKGTGTLQGA